MEMEKGHCDPGCFQGMCQVQGFGSVHGPVQTSKKTLATPSGFPSRISMKQTYRARKTNIETEVWRNKTDHLSLTTSELSS